MLPIVTPTEMAAIDRGAPEPVEQLIDRAGWHVARVARSMLGGVYGRRVTAVAGPGNNGADTRVAAAVLRGFGAKVEIVAPDAPLFRACDLVIDGAFGTGGNRAYRPATVVVGTPVLAVDIPSGVDGLTGVALGNPMRADRTITFAGLKPGLLLGPGAALAGQVEVADIGLDMSPATSWLFTEADARGLMPWRKRDDHKWKRSVWVVGGSAGMYGAPLLASRSALRSGAGIVWCGLPGQPAPGLGSEVVFHALPAAGWHTAVLDRVDRFGSLVVGCGLGRSADAAHAVQSLVAGADLPIVIDGDALRMLDVPSWSTPNLRSNVVLTPHDGEYEALTGARPGADRFAAARTLAQATGATVLLKGPLSIAASPDGACIASNAGDERLATAGTGDVLAGVIGAHLAAGLAPLQAAALGAWMHGAAGRSQARFGMVASDLVEGLSTVADRLFPASHGES